MSPDQVIAWAEQGVFTTLMIAAPLLITALALGLSVSIFQATTQIQEQTLAFIPKIAGVLIALVIFGPWMLSQAMTFATDIFSNLHEYIG
ncbi:flagellar biosynthesis protein FliQ [Salisediminibacterium halotolerans]|uniref:Flagellar biosynthetic protein FliQ n=1 Tax=Salisediminibacterium halotolerans TaxID=517425 RepID=A0A1H9Q6C2_9BACI|nr:MULTISPECIES: flagellar biosynthesis protein FliQ [Salisediminibacterium]RLJ74206.1 flagellar biosynthetic protein FliQ [Actinophytocola xinjiangensis]RPE87701.1 flagellar biosynthetic protein FliQ [Salisediminibacterium halotolerans]TWG35043.1 flagellar biosynthetic protein FliQ [Salisediminibacterium halotolerans]SER55665.1 flagellar biosynthetic protein FliQ [Salisediminibacterium haloalkalitolerans]GEL06670.1 flagellar biosynthetic protein FliQ [Salisediminibacterium halotolerans]